ncbi:ATP-binding protein [Actinospica durhamensis]|uniref:ATP-binding protein n=1 Tax=Actinospica durhamensis TaxID=1508375 RepID=A0A941EJP4_9ACTN|nr:ATP-binding protein [Actinospica durhamensis]MBR7832802.1 ATP-binding protein [Actinospica durhamensis]
MRIAFVGKGGSGKTTFSALFIRELARLGRPVVAVDADINQHLGNALGLTAHQLDDLAPMSAVLPEIKEYLRGENPRIASAAQMVKTTPPGAGSRLIRFAEASPLEDWCTLALHGELAGVRLMVTGAFAEQDLGVACYHSKVGAAELYLNHLLDGRGEYVVLDMTAGADAFASGLFTRFDVTFLVVEPTCKSVAVYRQYTEYASEYGIPVRVVGNKVADADDEAFLRAEIGDALVGWMGDSRYIRALDRGRRPGFEGFEPAGRALLGRMLAEVDATVRDDARMTSLAHLFHTKNALAWANRAAGTDVTAQIDPEFATPAR